MEEMEKFETTETAEIDNEKKKISTKIITTVAILIVIIAAGALAFNPIKTAIEKNKMYKEVLALIESESYSEAINPLKELGDYKDCNELYATAFEGARNAIKEYDGIIDAGIVTIARKADGTVIAAGENYNNRCNVYSWNDIAKVSTYGMSIGLKTDGTAIISGGYNYNIWYGYKPLDISGWKNLVSVSAGSDHVVGLKPDGTVIATGSNSYGECNVSEWKDVVAISSGRDFTLALKNNGTVYAAGNNDRGQSNVSDWKDIVAIAAGQYHSVGLKKDGTVVSTGDVEYGKCNVYDWTDIIAISADWSSTVGLKADGTVVCASNLIGFDTSSWTDVVAVSAGQDGVVGLKRDGTVYAVGQHFEGMETVKQWDLL